jgi:hypothetical protein
MEKLSQSPSLFESDRIWGDSMEGTLKTLSIICLALLFSCANSRHPSSLYGDRFTEDTIARGNVRATAVKEFSNQDVCFDISLIVKNANQNFAAPSNWTAAWIDSANQYHLLNLNQRDPASAPQGGRVAAQYGEYEEWNNSFRACASKARMGDVRSLVLTPKTLPFKSDDGLHLNWKN